MQHEPHTDEEEVTKPGAELGRWSQVLETLKSHDTQLEEIRRLCAGAADRTMATHQTVQALSRRSLHLPIAIASLGVLIAMYADAAAEAASRQATRAIDALHLERTAEARIAPTKGRP